MLNVRAAGVVDEAGTSLVMHSLKAARRRARAASLSAAAWGRGSMVTVSPVQVSRVDASRTAMVVREVLVAMSALSSRTASRGRWAEA